MSNVLSEEKRQQVIALGRLGWPLRRIEKETGVRRETAGDYLRAAGVALRPPGGWGRRSPTRPANGVSSDCAETAKPANEVSPDSEPPEAPTCTASASHCAPFLDFIEVSLSKGRNAKAIWQDLVDDHGFTRKRQTNCRVGRMLAWTTDCGQSTPRA